MSLVGTKPCQWRTGERLWLVQNDRTETPWLKPIHPKAMPVILTTNEQRDVWMRVPWMKPRLFSDP
jgi:hypothetical protein